MNTGNECLQGRSIELDGVPVPFSFWPLHSPAGIRSLQTHVYTSDPWTLIRSTIARRLPEGKRRDEAMAYAEQAEYLFRDTINASEWAARPLTFYYSLENLAKAFVVTVADSAQSFDFAHHGLKVKRSHNYGDQSDDDAWDSTLDETAVVVSDDSTLPNVFKAFFAALTREHSPRPDIPKHDHHYEVRNLMPQIVAGHRLWCSASDTVEHERFLPVDRISLLHGPDDTGKSMVAWADMHITVDNIKRVGCSDAAAVLHQSGASEDFSELDQRPDTSTLPTEVVPSRVLTLRMDPPITYTKHPYSTMSELIGRLRKHLWTVATTVAPYRRYYLHLAPNEQRNEGQVLPQLLGVYAVMFYLGSITRYRPQHFREVMESRYGEQIQELLTSQPSQVLYLMASEFARRDVVRAPLV